MFIIIIHFNTNINLRILQIINFFIGNINLPKIIHFNNLYINLNK